MDKETARQKIVELVEKYASQAEVYEREDYNEAQVKLDFINPLFKILGWDIDNEKGLTQYLREVILEDRVRVEGRIKHPDYAFRLGNTVLFDVETKKPRISIKDDGESAFQLRRYAWNQGLTISLLTNFREFAVYDCRVKPNPKDKAHVARLTYFTYQDLTGKQGTFGDMRDGFDFLWDTFTQENVSRGSFEKYIKDDGDRFKRGVLSVDEDFLQTLERWRIDLAKSLCRANKKITEQELNFIVPTLLNRIIFLRMAEARDIEPYGGLRKTIQTEGLNECYRNLYTLFHRADEKYNAGLFNLDKDLVSKKIVVSNQVLKTIIGGLYENNPYAFEIIPVEILGSAYERFLGNVITIKPTHVANVEQKMEVRKAGGVYYTPQYIVDQIVKKTIDPLLESKTPQEVAKIKIVDPSCGSGSFLLRAYQRLLDWHTYYYKANCPPSKGRKIDPLTPDGRLTATEKKKILLNNIFGVDIDDVAVEITKLSLLIKCMEGETTGSIEVTLRLHHEKILPNIDRNICGGNALVDLSFYGCSWKEKIPPQEFATLLEQVKPFDWKHAFPVVFKQGGFDVIIGNPPYVKEYTNREVFENVKRGALGIYYQGKMDLCYFFVCHGIDLLKENGVLGYIIPNNWTTNSGASILREKVVTESKIRCLYDFGNHKVFKNSSIQTMILILEKSKQEQYTFDYRRIALAAPDIDSALSLFAGEEAEGLVYLQPTLNVEERKESLLVFEESETEKVLKKIQEKRNFTLDKNTEIAQGIVPNPDVVTAKNITKIPRKIRIQEKIQIGHGVFVIENNFFSRLNKAEKKYIKQLYEPSQIRRYAVREPRKSIIYITKQNYNDDCPRIIAHLSKFKGIMAERRETKAKKLQYYHLHWGRTEEIFAQGPKILSVRKCAKPTFAYTEKEAFVMMAFNVIRSDRIDLKYLTAILNSRLIAFWLRHRGKMQGLQYQVDKEPLLNIPLVDTDDMELKMTIIGYVDELLQLYPQVDAALFGKKVNIENSIRYFEQEINRLVYQIYGITDKKEIAIIEANT